MLANKNVYQFQHCRNALEIENSLYISGLFDNFYVKNNFFHFCQNGIFGSDLVISDGISIRREENISASKVNHTNKALEYVLGEEIRGGNYRSVTNNGIPLKTFSGVSVTFWKNEEEESTIKIEGKKQYLEFADT